VQNSGQQAATNVSCSERTSQAGRFKGNEGPRQGYNFAPLC